MQLVHDVHAINNLSATYVCQFSTGVLPCPNAKKIEMALQSLPPNALVVWDVGNTLLVPRDTLLNRNYRPWIREWLDKKAPQVGSKGWDELEKAIYQQAKWQIVDPLLPKLIQTGQGKAKVIALSRYWVGVVPSNSEVTFELQLLQALKESGIVFGNPFPKAQGWEDKKLQVSYLEGLVVTEADWKWPVLEAFLQEVGSSPEAILFIDDRKDQCENIYAGASMKSISTQCLNYTEVSDRTPPLNEKVASLQLRTVVGTGLWLSDEEARRCLN